MTKSLKYSPTRDEVLKALGAVSETEYKKLEQQLAIATKALESIASRMTWNEISQSKAEQALKEIEEVK